MNLLWPGILALLIIIPILIVAYIVILRRRKRYTVRYSSLTLVRAAIPRYSRLRRHLPFAVFLAALACLITAFSRPYAVVAVPTNQTTIILSIDVSRSMCSTDIDPSRIQAAQAAADSFIANQKATTQMGLVAFSGFAELVQPPTTDQGALEAAVNSLATGFRTAIGAGILKSIDAISEIDSSVPPSVDDPAHEPTPVPKGDYVPDIIVLLTDGVSNTGPLPLDAAQQAEDRGIRVYTIGFGTAQGSEFPNCSSDQFYGRDPFGGPPPGGGGYGGGYGGGNGGFRRGIDEDTLKQVSAMTGGEYYAAESGSELENVFQNLPTYLIVKHETQEISVIFTGIGAILALIAVGLSLIWHPVS